MMMSKIANCLEALGTLGFTVKGDGEFAEYSCTIKGDVLNPFECTVSLTDAGCWDVWWFSANFNPTSHSRVQWENIPIITVDDLFKQLIDVGIKIGKERLKEKIIKELH